MKKKLIGWSLGIGLALLAALIAFNLESVGRRESALLAPPAKRFSTYARYDLKPMVLSEAVRRENDKLRAAGEFETVLRAKLQPLLDNWQANPADVRFDTLVIEPQLVSLKIIRGGAGFWAAAFTGEPRIDIDLVISDQSNGREIAKPRLTQYAEVGRFRQTDQKLMDYIASTAYHYLAENY
jgi:hypothetical protein